MHVNVFKKRVSSTRDRVRAIISTVLSVTMVMTGFGAIALMGASSAQAANRTVWDRLADCESSGDFSNRDTGHNGHYGGFQFSIATWHGVGGSGNPADASPAEQLHRAKILLAQSGPGQWACAPTAGLTRSNGAVQGLSILGQGVRTPSLTVKPRKPVHVAPRTISRTPAAKVHASGIRYTVKSGDTLFGIAGSGWQKLYALNRAVIGNDPNLIYPGQVFRLTGSASVKAPTVTTPAIKVAPKPRTPVLRPVVYSSAGARAVAFALAQVGKAYVYGATGPRAFDCSGLTQAAWHAAGVNIPRVSSAQLYSLHRVSLSALRPGDIIGYYSGGHVAIYIGGGKVVGAENPGTGIVIIPLNWGSQRAEMAVRP